LVHLACEVKLKQLITHALTLTTQSLAITSVSTAKSSSLHHQPKLLSTAAFETLFTMSPADLPNKSAAAIKLALGDRDDEDEEENIPILKDRQAGDAKWQIAALLAQRSAVKEAFFGFR
jgi:hypothetical protein